MSALWIFGYGSLVWRPAFSHQRRLPARIRGYKRRLWQSSPLHRGTPESPGRVATLLPEQDAECWGMAYEVSHADSENVLEKLDYRERTGYERVLASLDIRGVGETPDVLVYIATRENQGFIGPETEQATARIIRGATGESGPNREYLERLHQWLASMQIRDPHVESLMQHLGEVGRGP